MAPQDDYSDDYVAKLLAQDAKTISSKSFAVGYGSSLPKRASNNAPKANTRFLKSIIKETDTHNAGLKAREAREATGKLRDLRRESKRSETDPSSTDSRHDRASYASKRRRLDNRDEDHDKDGRERVNGHRSQAREDEYGATYEGSHRRQRHRSREHAEGPYTHHRPHPRRAYPKSDRSSSPSSHRRAHAAQSRSRSPNRGAYDTHDPRHRRRRRPRDDERSDGGKKSSDQGHSSRQRKHKSKRPASRHSPSSSDSSPERRLVRSGSPTDSDPLDAIIGPAPKCSPSPPRPRGRGAARSGAGMDARFSASYNPAEDIEPDINGNGDGDDWEQALEALRDRQKWHQQGADRLRAAGFTEAEVDKWAKGKSQRSGPGDDLLDETDVQWTRKGESREWDRGKVVTGDGHVRLQARWDDKG